VSQYRRIVQRRPVLGAFGDQLQKGLAEDQKLLKRLRRSAVVSFEQLQREGHAGGYYSFRRFVQDWRRRQSQLPAEAFIPLVFASFAHVGNFASYCRCVSTQRLSDGKSKGSGNRKNGNRYLRWAFTAAAQMARRFNSRFRSYYDRKAAQTNSILATRALSNKLARVCYYIMRDQVEFREELTAH